MARKNTPVTPWVAGVAIIVIIASASEKQWGALLFSIAVLCATLAWHLGFRLRTKCGVITQSGRPCNRGTRGIIRGCKQDHYWDKILAWTRFLGLAPAITRVGMAVPRLGSTPDPGISAMPSAGTAPVPGQHAPPFEIASRRELVNFYCTLISTVATIVGTVVGVIAL